MPDYGLPDQIRVFIITPDQQQFDLSLESRDLTTSTVSPGGDLAIDFGLYGTLPYSDTILPIGTHVALEDKVGPFRSGFIVGPSGNLPHRAGDVRLTARGYSAACGLRRYEHSTIYLNPSVGAIIIGSRNDLCCPPLSGNNDYLNLEAMGSRSDGDSQDFVGTDALTMWNSYIPIGTPFPDVQPLLWHVITAPDGMPTLQVDVVPNFARYVVRINEGAVDSPSWALDDVDNQVVASYLDNLGHPHVVLVNQIDNPLKFGLTGTPIVKSKAINLSGEFAESDATQYAHNIINRFAALRMSGSSINIPWGVAVTDRVSGEDVPLWRVRSGEKILVIITPDSDPTGYLSEEERFISGTSWNGTNYGLTLTTGDLRTETRNAQRRQSEKSAAVLGNIPGLSKRDAPPLQPRDVLPQPLGPQALAGGSKYPSSEEHVHQGPDPTDVIWHQMPVRVITTKKGTEYRLEGCAIPIPYHCKVLGWTAVGDGPMTGVVNVQFGTYAEYEGHSTSMNVGLGGARKAHWEVPITELIDVPANSVVQFQTTTIEPTTATFMTISVIVKHAGVGWGGA